jgi:hypothetical protein
MRHHNNITKLVKSGMIPFLLLLFVMLSQVNTLAQPFVTKQGGISFRIENNPQLSKLAQMNDLFSSYGTHFGLAITSWVFPIAPEYVDSLISLSNQGHEIMDNTPTHQTQFFNLINAADTTFFSGHPGVDHFYQNRVCLRYAAVDTFQNHNEGLINIAGNMVISQDPGEFANLNGNPYFFALYFNEINKVFLWYDLSAVDPVNPDTLFVQSFWEEPVNLGVWTGLSYHKLTQQNVIMMPEAMLLLAQHSLDLFEQNNIPAPETWIHPNGQMPLFSGYQIKAQYGDSLGYSSASNYINKARLCFNEYNPYGISQFGMQNNEISMMNHSFAWNRDRLADYVAKHYVKIDVSNLQNPMGGWDSYLARMDSLLAWCQEYEIPIGTYTDWKTWLYDSVPLKITDIFPALHHDYNENNYPDGYDQNAAIAGIYDTTQGVPESGNCSFVLSEEGIFCEITHLAGLEKGNNFFEMWIRKDGPDTTIALVEAIFTFPENGMIQTRDYQVDTSVWVKYTDTIFVPDSISIMNVSIIRTDTLADTVFISGMNFRSAGFLNRSAYPHQEVYQNEQFENIDLFSLVIDTLYAPSSITWWINQGPPMEFRLISSQFLQPLKPTSFWIGSDTAWLMAQSPDGALDSCRLTFSSIPMTGNCPGVPVTITLLDTLDNDFIHWTSVPYDSTISDSTVYNPTVNPSVTTMYYVEAISPLGPIHYDSILIERYPVPDSIIPYDTAVICGGDSTTLMATGCVAYLWNTGDTSSSIRVSPPENTTYTVWGENAFGCSNYDTVEVVVRQKPGVGIVGLWPAYCVYDYSSSVFGNPPGGILEGPGISGDIFYPDSANIGSNQITYQYTDPYGCSNADTIYVWIYPRPEIQPLPSDTTVCAGQSITLNAGSGNGSYLWSNGVADSIVTVDTTGVGLGTYRIWVYVTENGCVNMDTTIINFIECPIGIGDPENQPSFRIYPNPAHDQITIRQTKGNNTLFEVAILSLQGESLLVLSDNHQEVVCRIDHLSPGMYFIKITVEGISSSSRLVIY